MTAPEKGRWYWVRNWLHYHWVYLVIAAVVLWVGISWLANALNWGDPARLSDRIRRQKFPAGGYCPLH
jgi:hypothetical protein